jgi:hypothetical protein
MRLERLVARTLGWLAALRTMLATAGVTLRPPLRVNLNKRI